MPASPETTDDDEVDETTTDESGDQSAIPANEKPLSVGKARLFDPNEKPGMPEVRQNAVDAASKPAGETSDGSGPLDRFGNPFDPEIHESEGGIPKLTPKGRLRSKFGKAVGGRVGTPGSGSTASQSKVDPTGGTPAPDPQLQQTAAQIAATAALCTALTFTLGRMIGGEEFTPIVRKDIGVNEPEEFKAAWTSVCERYQIIDVPPWAALVLVSFGYVGKRWNAPIFSVKRKGWWTRMKHWIFRKKYEKERKMEAQKARDSAGINRPAPDPVVHDDNTVDPGGQEMA